MPNRFTAIPADPVPPLPAVMGPFIAAADIFMLVMFSRPSTGSLRRTWVTPATRWMCLATTILGAGLAVWLGTRGNGAGAVVGAIALTALATGSAAVVIVAGAQDRARRARTAS